MRTTRTASPLDVLPDAFRALTARWTLQGIGLVLIGVVLALGIALASWRVGDPSLSHATDARVRNWLGLPGAIVADLVMQMGGLAAVALLVPPAVWGWRLFRVARLDDVGARVLAWIGLVLASCVLASLLPRTGGWPLPTGLGGVVGDAARHAARFLFGENSLVAGLGLGIGALLVAILSLPVALRAPSGDDANDAALPAPAPAARAVPSARLTIGDPSRDAPWDASPRAPARRVREDEDDDRAGEPGLGVVLIGAAMHRILSWKAALRRSFTPAPEAAHAAPNHAPSHAPRRREPPAFEPPADDDAHDARAAQPFNVHAPRAEPAAARAPAPLARAARVPAPMPVPVRSRAPISAPVPPPSPEPEDEDPFEDNGNDLELRGSPGRAQPENDATEDDVSGDDVSGDEDDEAGFEPPPLPAASFVRRGRNAPGPAPAAPAAKSGKAARAPQPEVPADASYEAPPIDLLAEPRRPTGPGLSKEHLRSNAAALAGVLDDFGVKGEVVAVRPGPVVTLYEIEPAPGTKSSKVIALADDIARSMSAISARVAVVQGRNAIGVELPNERRETVYFREMVESAAFEDSKAKLALCLGKTIGGEPVITDLAKMPHLLVAGTTGSGKSVAINTMILSLLYRLTPAQCRLIMVDPKMLELSVYDGIPHLLSPVVTDPKKAVVALKWAVREMEDRYRRMSRLGVRNIDGYNVRVAEARAKGERLTRIVETGFDRETGEMLREEQDMPLDDLPFIVVIVDEMADLMMVAGKDIEGAIQRLAQMARAAGIHLIMATQRPSVDVITGTIKANFPTRISFQVTSKIDSRTILGEQGAEQLLGQGDMLHMMGGGRISRVHGPFVSDAEVEAVVAHLKAQGRPDYLDAVTRDETEEPPAKEEDDGPAIFDRGDFNAGGGAGDTYEQAVAVVMRDRKASTSYIQRRLQIGYNRAASLMERMEKEGIVGPANHAGKREILVDGAGGRGDDDE